MNREEYSQEPDQDDIVRKIAELARPDCAAHCKLAQVKARQAGGFVIREISSLVTAQRLYSDAVQECEGPEEIKVCGAPEGEKTYECKILGRLMTLNFEE